MLWILLAIGIGFVIIERLWPAAGLPRVHAWWPRVVLINLIQLGIVVLAGYAWDRWLNQAALFHLADHMATSRKARSHIWWRRSSIIGGIVCGTIRSYSGCSVIRCTIRRGASKSSLHSINIL